MRRFPRLALCTVVLGALVAGGCAEITDGEQAALDEAIEAVAAGLPTEGSFPAPDDEISDEPWVRPLAEGTPPTPLREGTPPEITQFRCPFDRHGLDAEARCGKIELPGRGVDERYTIELAFVRFSATGDAEDIAPDPVVYLHGGPGGAILDDAAYWYDSIVAPHVEHRDVILYDQRGGGRSTTLPTCHEATTITDRFYTDVADHASLASEYHAALAACAAKFADRTDVDTTAFNSSANAQDLVDLMWALGITEYNIHGSSYGTRLAQTVLRDAPQGIRSVVLSGAYPVDANLMGSVSTALESSLDAVFAGCAAVPECDDALPDPWATLETLVAQLDASPMPVEVPTTHDGSYTIHFDGTDLLNGIHGLLYVGYEAATVPDLLIDHLDGDDRRLRRLATASIFDHVDTATFLLVQCADEAPFTTAADLDRPLAHPFLRAVELAPAVNGLDSLTICAAWNTGETDPIENDPVTWDVPTLLLAGAVDPITPPEWATRLAARLPRSRLVVQAGLSHDSDEGWCSLELIGDFVARPDVLQDTSCAGNEEHLVVTTSAERFEEPLELIDASLDLDGDDAFADIRLPDWVGDWRDDVHIRWRALDAIDPTALIVLDAGADYDLVEHLPFGGVIPDWVAEPTSSEPAGWTRWTMRTTGGDIISYVRDSDAFEIAIVVEPDEPDDLEQAVLRPVAISAGPGAPG